MIELNNKKTVNAQVIKNSFFIRSRTLIILFV